MKNFYITKGTRVRFDFFRKSPNLVSLAGVQDKFEAKHFVGEGTVRNIWADDPLGDINPRFNVELDDGTFIEVPKSGIVKVF